MANFIEKYFQVGLIQWMSYPPERYNVVDNIKKIASDEFFSAIEIGQIKDDSEREKIRDLLAHSHLRICYGAQTRLLSTGLNPNDLVEAERLKAEKTLIEAVDEAEYLGAKSIAFLAGHWDEGQKEQAFSQLVKTTVNVCNYANEKGILVELETFDYDLDKKALMGPAPYVAKFAAEVRNKVSNFGLIVDLSHFPTTDEESKFVFQVLRPYITHLHIGNAVVEAGQDGYGDQHPRFGFPKSANDTEQLLDFFQVCQAEGFFNAAKPMVLSFEVKPRENEEADIVMANTKRVIKRAWSLLD